MSNEQINKKEYLIHMFNNIQGEDIGLEEYESVRWFELRGFTYEEARNETLNKYRAKLLNDNEITQTIIEYQDIELLFSGISDDEDNDRLDNKKKIERYIDSISSKFSMICDFDIQEGKVIDPNNIISQIIEIFIANEIVKGCIQVKEYQESQLRQYENLANNIVTKAEQLGKKVTLYGFLDLPKVKAIESNDSKIKLFELIANNGIPYAIAMFDYLEFIKHLTLHYFKAKDSLFKEISRWFNSDIDGRTIKGNISSLGTYTAENKTRYTAYKHTKKVAKDYEKLK